MTDDREKPPAGVRKPGRTVETEAREAERRRRLAAALRDNLRRRKGPAGEPAASPSSAARDWDT